MIAKETLDAWINETHQPYLKDNYVIGPNVLILGGLIAHLWPTDIQRLEILLPSLPIADYALSHQAQGEIVIRPLRSPR